MMKNFNLLFMTILSAVTLSCSNGPCKIEDRMVKKTDGDQVSMTAKKDLTTHVHIYKPDGSLQCGMGQKIDLVLMAKELENMRIFSSENKNDGLMRIQLCGQPTGSCNVYEISENDLDKALKLGFKKWLRD